MTGVFFSLLDRLVKAGVDFVIVGGFAGAMHGCALVTQDLDICLVFSQKNLLPLQEAIHDLHPVHRMTPARKPLELTDKNCEQFKNLYLDTDMGRLDCLSYISGVGEYKKVKEVSVNIETDGIRLRVLSLDALIESKKTMNRPRDKQAILELEAIKKIKESE